MNPAEERCPTDEELLRYLEAATETESLVWIEAHLNRHEACQQRLADLCPLPAQQMRGLLPSRLRPPDVPGYTYELDDNGWPVELGRGGLGAVYKARPAAGGDPVAIKFLFYWGDDAAARFAREVGASLELKHPGIVHAVEFGKAESLLYYVMEYVEGQSLKKYLDGRPFRAGDAARWGPEVAGWTARLGDAIQDVHANGLIHRDLKPDNVLVRLEDGRPVEMKICDFGLARRINTPRVLTQDGQFVGTACYAAPEQLDGREVTPAADVYGVGGVLYTMLTGRPPFDPLLPDLRERILKADPERPGKYRPGVSRELETICLKCLRKAPGDRYDSAAELAEDLRRFAAGHRPLARRQTGLDRLGWWVRHNPRAVRAFGLVVGLFVCCAVFLGFALFYFFQERERKREADGLAFLRLLDAAQFALDRGQLTVALPLFDQTVTAAPAEQRLAIEVKRLRCLFAFGNWPQLQAELDRLGGRDDLPEPLRAQVWLHRGDVGLWDPAPEAQTAALDSVRRALAVPEGLAPADAAYARGLLADSAPGATGHFEEALRHERFHLRANAALLMELTLTGQLEPAKRRAEFMSAVFPKEPVPPLALAVMATLEEDAPARARHLAELRRLVDDKKRMGALEVAFAALDQTIRANHRMHGRQQPDWWAALQPVPLAERLVPAAVRKQLRPLLAPPQVVEIPAAVGVGLPVLTRPVRMLEALNEAYAKLRTRDYAGAAALLEEAERKYPEALIRLMDAITHLSLAQMHEQRREREACWRESRRAHELAEQAAAAPTLLPFAPYRDNARWVCVLIEIAWGAQRRFDAALLAGASVAPDPGNPLAVVATLAAGQERLRTYPTPTDRHQLVRLAADSHDYEFRSELLPLLVRYFEVDDARLLLRAWSDDDPEDPQPFRLRARLELTHGNAAEAVRWAEQGLAAQPKDRELRDVLDRAREHLKSAHAAGK